MQNLECRIEVDILDEKIKKLYQIRQEIRCKESIQNKLRREIIESLIRNSINEYITADGLKAKLTEVISETVDKKFLKENYPEIFEEVKNERCIQYLMIL